MFWQLHSNLSREAPGSNASTVEALSIIPDLPSEPSILDIGCGPGAQTLALARTTGGRITAVDLHQPFLDTLRSRAESAGLDSHITTVHGSMFELDLPEKSFDLIWSEGAIYIIGFTEGLRAWRRFLKPGGYIAVTELSWLTHDIPDEPRRFWNGNYPAMVDIDDNLAKIESAGYTPIGYFILPESAWWDEYYSPLTKKIAELRERYSDNPEALAEIDVEQREIDLFGKYPDVYGYVFYVMKG